MDNGKFIVAGASVFILGESSFTRQEGKRGDHLPLDWNEGIIESVSKRLRDTTITRAAGVFFGMWRSWEQRWDFWQAAAFANFVQVDMGCPGQRPNDKEWKTGNEPFKQYLNDLQPQFVLALGAELWTHLPFPDDKGQVRRNGLVPRPYYLYSNRNGKSFVFAIDHPIARGRSYAKWTPWVEEALKTAIEFHNSGK